MCFEKALGAGKVLSDTLRRGNEACDNETNAKCLVDEWTERGEARSIIKLVW